MVVADMSIRHQLFNAVQGGANNFSSLALAGQFEGQEEGLDLHTGRVQLGQDRRRFRGFVAATCIEIFLKIK